jgi:TolB-like protein
MRFKTLSKSLVGLAFLSSVAVAQSKPTVAVISFTNSALGASNKDLEPLSKGIADLLAGSLAANPNIRVVERDRIQAVLEEQKLGADGKLDQAAMVKVGKILGAKHMITGVFITEVPKGAAAAPMRLSARVINTETSEIEKLTLGDVTGKTDGILSLIDKLGANLNKDLKLPDIPAAARDAHEASIKRQEKVPFSAVMLYSRALDEQDHGNKEKAVTLFKQSIAAFPSYEAPQAALKKLEGK